MGFYRSTLEPANYLKDNTYTPIYGGDRRLSSSNEQVNNCIACMQVSPWVTLRPDDCSVLYIRPTLDSHLDMEAGTKCCKPLGKWNILLPCLHYWVLSEVQGIWCWPTKLYDLKPDHLPPCATRAEIGWSSRVDTSLVWKWGKLIGRFLRGLHSFGIHSFTWSNVTWNQCLSVPLQTHLCWAYWKQGRVLGTAWAWGGRRAGGCMAWCWIPLFFPEGGVSVVLLLPCLSAWTKLLGNREPQSFSQAPSALGTARESAKTPWASQIL